MINISSLALCLAFLTPFKLPFTVDATENASAEFPEAPRVESFSFAQWEGRWVFIGGRIVGYHALGGAPAEFARADANRQVWVVDTNVKPARTYHVPVDLLPANLAIVKDEWIATGQLSYQDGASLYIGGGYGQDSAGHWVTYPLLSKVNLPLLIKSVMAGKLPPESIAFSRSPLVQSAGGDLVKLSGNDFYLVMGHVFMGSYTTYEGQGEHNGETASQTYLGEIRKLRVVSNAQGGLSITLVQSFKNDQEFRRRDLNVAKILSPKGLGLAAYGGVFTPDTQLSYSKPIYLSPNSPPAVDTSFDQKLNAYNCAKLLLYDGAAQTMYTTFFGGISRFAWDPVGNKFVENPRVGSKSERHYMDGMQWSDQISTIRRTGTGATSEMIQTDLLPAYVGANALFIPLPGLHRAAVGTDILDLKSLRGTKTLIGYIYGGIRAFPFRFPYDKTAPPYDSGAVPTQPSDLILKVYLTCDQSDKSDKPFHVSTNTN